MELTIELLDKIRKNAFEEEALDFPELSAEQLTSLFEALKTNETIKKIRIDKINKENPILPVDAIQACLETNKSLTDISISLFGPVHSLPKVKVIKPEKLVRAIQKNTNLTSFYIDTDNEEFNTEIQTIVERNKPLCDAAQLYIYDAIKALEQITTSDAKLAIAEMQALISSIKKNLPFSRIIPALTTIKSRFSGIDDVQDIILKLTKNILEFEFEAVNFGNSPIHVFYELGEWDKLKELYFMNHNMNCQNYSGSTILHFAASRGESTHISYLIASLKANPNFRDYRYNLPIHSALQEGYDEAALILESKGKESLTQAKKFLLVKKLSFLFGSKLKSVFSDEQKKMKESKFDEGFKLISALLPEFISSEMDKEKKEKLNSIHSHFNDIYKNYLLTPVEKLAKVETPDFLILPLLCQNHLLGALLEKTPENNGYQLIVTERGIFADELLKRYPMFVKGTSPDEIHRFLTEKMNEEEAMVFVASIKFPSILKLPIPKESIKEMVEQLSRFTGDLSENEARELLFKKMPAIVKSDWQYNQHLLQSALKDGICFYGNLKALLLAAFTRSFGEEEGYVLYKNFSYFLREKTLDAYKKYADPNDPIVKEAERILEKKKEKLSARPS